MLIICYNELQHTEEQLCGFHCFVLSSFGAKENKMNFFKFKYIVVMTLKKL